MGNPPYGDLPTELELQVSGSLFQGVARANRSRNQYTKFASSLVHLLRDDGFGAMITPLGMAYNNASTKNLRREIRNQNRCWSFAFFDRSPDALFGDTVKTRNVVLFCEPSSTDMPEVRTTHLLRWTRTARASIWSRIKPVSVQRIDITDFVPKIGSDVELQAWLSIRSRTTYLASSLRPHGKERDATLYCYSTAYNWLPFFRGDPKSFADHTKTASSSTREYAFGTSQDADFFYACLVSSLSFWLWTIESDGFHVSNSFIERLPYAPGDLALSSVTELARLAGDHDAIIRKHPIVKANAGKQILNFNRHAAENIVQRIDAILVEALALTREFSELLQDRVHDLIYAGRKTTRVHFPD